MGALLSYSIVSGLLLLAMFLAYRLFMAADNQHAYNRGVILAIYAFSFLTLPVMGIVSRIALLDLPVNTVDQIEGLFMADITIGTDSKPLWGTVVLWIFIAGMIVTAARTSAIWIRIIRTIRSGERIVRDGFVLILTDDCRVAPFSWIKYMVMSRRDYASCGPTIEIHELRHIRCRHWIDLLIAQVVVIVNWFNPAAWLMRDELMLVHEYQADMAVIEAGLSPKDYQLLLIKKAVGARFPSLANSFNHSKLKKRITMMYKSKSNATARFKVLALAPAAALALVVAAVPPVKAAISTIGDSDVLAGKVSEISADNVKGGDTFRFRNINNHDGKTTVTLSGIVPGNSLSVDGVTLHCNGSTYEANGINCSMIGGDATILATFPFLDTFEDVSLDLSANGKIVKLNLEPYFDGSDARCDTVIVVNG